MSSGHLYLYFKKISDVMVWCKWTTNKVNYNKSGQLVTEGVQRNFQHTYIPYNTIKLRQNETKTLQEQIS